MSCSSGPPAAAHGMAAIRAGNSAHSAAFGRFQAEKPGSICRWQAARCSRPTRRLAGGSLMQRGSASGQRGAKEQPGGACPVPARCREWRRGGGAGRSRSAAPPAGPACRDGAAAPKRSRPGPSSTRRPAYMTATRLDVLGDHAEIVADQHQRHAGVAADAGEQGQDLRLDGGVERGRRLVGHQQIGLPGQRHGDHDALVLAARKLVRIVARAVAWRRRCRPGRADATPRRRAAAPTGRDAASAPRRAAGRCDAPG